TEDLCGPSSSTQIQHIDADESRMVQRGIRSATFERQRRADSGTQHFPRSPKVLLGGMAHYLLDFPQIQGEEYERRVLERWSDEDLLAWVQANNQSLSPEDVRQWNTSILNEGPKDEAPISASRPD